MWCVFIKQTTAYEMRISDWSSVCSSDLRSTKDYYLTPLPSCRTCSGIQRTASATVWVCDPRWTPERVRGDGYYEESGGSPNPAARSLQPGFCRSIRLHFQSRGHFFIVFSRAITASIVSATSYQTRHLQPLRLVKPSNVPSRCCMMRPMRLEVTPTYSVPR